jgi:hypothetical protein
MEQRLVGSEVPDDPGDDLSGAAGIDRGGIAEDGKLVSRDLREKSPFDATTDGPMRGDVVDVAQFARR